MSFKNKKIPKTNVPGIPPAPILKKVFQSVDYDFVVRKDHLGHRLPYLTKEEIEQRRHPYHVLLLHDLMSRGYYDTVKEVNNILRKEERERKGGKYRRLMGAKLVTNREKLHSIVEVLQLCQDFTEQEDYESPTVIRKNYGEKLMKEGDIWLAKHFLFSGLQSCLLIQGGDTRKRLEAEIHCLLAFLARDNAENLERALEGAIDHLTVCRELAKGRTWNFRPRVLTIKIKKPINLHGLRDEYEIVDGCSMPLYMIATLLEHEMLIGLANQILHTHKYPTEEDIQQAHVFADNALKLAFEARQPVALSAALMRFGIVLRHTGAYDDAITYFKQLVHHAEVTGDQQAYCIAFHNLAICYIGKHDPITALESLAKQKDTSQLFRLEDLEADALQEFGHVLLQEGQLWESEECYTCAYECFARLELEQKSTHNHCENNLAMWAISAGQKLWSRFAGLARNEKPEHLSVMLEWKNRRQALVPVPRPNYDMLPIVAEYDYDPSLTDSAGLEQDEEEHEPEKIERKSPISPSEIPPGYKRGKSIKFSDENEDEEILGYTALFEQRAEEFEEEQFDEFESDKNHSPAPVAGPGSKSRMSMQVEYLKESRSRSRAMSLAGALADAISRKSIGGGEDK